MEKKLWIVRVNSEAHRRVRLYSVINQVHSSTVVSELILKGLPPEDQLTSLAKIQVNNKVS